MKVAQVDVERTQSTSRKLKLELGEALKREKILQAKLNNQVKRNLRLDETCKGLEDELLILHQKCDRFARQQDKQQQLESACSDMEQRLERLQEANRRLEIQLDVEKRHHKDAESQQESYKSQCSQLQQEKRRLENCLAQTVESRERALLENGYLKSEIVDLRNRLLKSHLQQSTKPHSYWDQPVHEDFD